MSKKVSDDLIKKYLAAESTITEEEKLFNAKSKLPEIEEWSSYIKRKRKTAPSNLSESMY